MKVLVNGKNVEVEADKATIANLMSQLEVVPVGVAVAIGTAVIPQAKWEEYQIEEGSKVTIIRATQGG